MATDAPPPISVVVPTYERPRQLQFCLGALAELRYPRYEVLVVDDGSREPLGEAVASVVERFDEMTLVRQQNAGPAAARNRGARTATGRYVAFTDDDCRPARDWLRALAAQFSKTPHAMVGGRTVNTLSDNIFSTASQALVSFLYDEHNGDDADAYFLASNNVALPRERFLGIGGFDDAFPRAAGEDRELCNRWHARGGHMVYMPDAIVRHAHPLTLRSFLRQQFNYGRGAYLLHTQKQSGSESGKGLPHPPTFYLRLLMCPFRRQARSLDTAVVLSLLALVAQGAVAAGSLREALARQ